MVATQNVPIEDLDARVDRMHKRDRIGALAFILALWIMVLFVLGSVWPLVTVPRVRIILVDLGRPGADFQHRLDPGDAAPLRRATSTSSTASISSISTKCARRRRI